MQRLTDHVLPENTTVMAEVDTRHRQFRKATLHDTGVLYGQRPCDLRVWYSSPYEFVKDWEVVMLSYPQTLKDAPNPRHHVRLTKESRAKMEAHGSTFDDANLTAGLDYLVKDEGG